MLAFIYEKNYLKITTRSDKKSISSSYVENF